MTTLVVSTAATWAMVGLIWMAQLVQYPMLATYWALAPRPLTISDGSAR